MVKQLLDAKSCAKCKYCCDFLPEETLVRYSEENYQAMQATGIDTSCLFKTEEGYYTYSSYDFFKSNPSAESMPCPFLDSQSGCILSADSKPMPCKLWPFMLVKRDEHYWLMLAKTCSAISPMNSDELRVFAEANLKAPLIEYIQTHLELIRTSPIEDGIDILQLL